MLKMVMKYTFGIYFLISWMIILNCSNCCLAKGKILPAQNMSNVSYGSDPEQIMDIYLPEGRNTTATKVILLIHDGGWDSGSKTDIEGYIHFFQHHFPQHHFPQHVVVNMDYRLGTMTSPGFPKQVDDIGSVIQHMKANKETYNISPEFGLLGRTEGAHLALLYGYGFDKNKDVKVICNMAGLTDLTYYAKNPANSAFFIPLIGNISYEENPQIFQEVSPVYHVTSESPKTIGFYGTPGDEAISKFQGEILEDKLDSVGVCNKLFAYNAGYGNWTENQSKHVSRKLVFFFRNYL